ncbi:MAG: hypothetical protein ACE5E5_09525 [Phycisphaerae bacterium]
MHTGAGAIIGQFLFDGEQVKGEVNSKVVEVVAAAERDASDRISRDRIPRQYQEAVKRYFSAVHKSMGNPPSEDGGASSEASPNPGEAEGGS